MESNFLTRKEIASLIYVSVRTVRRNEDRWGLNKFRIQITSRMIRFKKTEVLKLLQKKNFI